MMNDAVRRPLDSVAEGGLLSPGLHENNWCAQDVADALGGDVDDLGVLAPKPGHSAKDRSLRVMIGAQFRDGYYVCSAYKNESEDGRELLNHVLCSCRFLPARGAPGIPLTEEQRAERAERLAARDRERAEANARKRTGWLSRWSEATPVTGAGGSSVITYLTSRKVALPLNVFRQTLFARSKQQAFAYGMMAEIVAPSTGEPFAFHVTYLANSGLKTEWKEPTASRRG
jgi:hypothetical protein